MDLFIKYLNGRNISRETIIGFFESRSKIKDSTRARNKCAIRKIIRQSMGNKFTPKHEIELNKILNSIKLKKPNYSITEYNIITEEEFEKLLLVSGIKTRLIIEFLYKTACRVTEMCEIKLSDCKNTNKGYVAIKLYRKFSKEDIVYIQKNLFTKILRAYGGTRYLFEVKGHPISRFTVITLLKNAGKKIGRPDLHPHMMRHSWATRNVEKIGISKVSKYLSHSKTGYTADIYLHGKPTIDDIKKLDSKKTVN
jgi:integrase